MVNKKIFLDMDGVLVDYQKGIKEHSLEKPKEFWKYLPPTKEFEQILSIVENYLNPSDIYVLSSPALYPECFSGKATWIRDHMPKYLPRLILTSHKYLLANPRTLLIDDHDKNTELFKQHKGKAFLVNPLIDFLPLLSLAVRKF